MEYQRTTRRATSTTITEDHACSGCGTTSRALPCTPPDACCTTCGIKAGIVTTRPRFPKRRARDRRHIECAACDGKGHDAAGDVCRSCRGRGSFPRRP